MKVILKEDMENLGEKDQVVDVADGYARNYLLPKGIAVEATEGNLRQVKEKAKAKERREEIKRTNAEEQAEKINGQMITIKAKTGDSEKLFGSITRKNIVDTFYETTGMELDTTQIKLEENIKEIGVHSVPIQLYQDIEAVLSVQVVEG